MAAAATAGNLMPAEPWLPVPGRVGRNFYRQEGNVGRRREVLRADRVGSPVGQDQLAVRKRDASPGVEEIRAKRRSFPWPSCARYRPLRAMRGIK